VSDWRTSVLAALFANVANHIFNNAWIFVDRGHRGWCLLRQYYTYLRFCLVGMIASTLTFAGLIRVDHAYLYAIQPGKESYIIVLGFQLVGIFVGAVFNYGLPRRLLGTIRRTAGSGARANLS
jgi:putative flippase GtrA